MSKNTNQLGALVKNQKSSSTNQGLRENEDSTLVSGNLASRVSTDSTWRTANIQLYRGAAAHNHWIRSPRVRNSCTCDGSEVEASVHAAPGSLPWIRLADRREDSSRIYYFQHVHPL